MKIKLLRSFIIFLFCMLLACGVAWIGGYNFDHRSPQIAVNAVLALATSAIITFVGSAFYD